MRLSLVQLLRQMLVPPRQGLDLVLRGDIEFRHFLLEELDLQILLIKLILQEAFFVGEELLTTRRDHRGFR